jgi:GrpB-like predicted nucleotidyltransferase (UPF0157 family)/chloramphenicol 3-O-phosphotransferase
VSETRRAGPAVYLISGPMAAGKTTVARLLAERFERGVHLEGDVFRRSIVSGRAEPTPELSPEALEQLRLRYRLAAAAADGYAAAGFTVALEDVVAGPLLGEFRTLIRSRLCHVVVLLPSLEAVTARETGRDDTGYAGGWTVEGHYDDFAHATPRTGLWLDTTDQTPEESVDAILAGTDPASATSREPIVVVEYDDAWPAQFEEIARPIRSALSPLGASVEHVGSTSVSGLPAKPVIDVDVVLSSSADVAWGIDLLRALGYVHQGDKGIPGREAFLWPPGAHRHHLYLVVAGSSPHRDHVEFRDHLRQHPEVAREYAALKRSLAERCRDDRAAYEEGKDGFVSGVLRAARETRQP